MEIGCRNSQQVANKPVLCLILCKSVVESSLTKFGGSVLRTEILQVGFEAEVRMWGLLLDFWQASLRKAGCSVLRAVDPFRGTGTKAQGWSIPWVEPWVEAFVDRKYS